jgi:hypothetical protein
VIEKSLAKDRDSRYGSMAEMTAALKAVHDQIAAGIETPATQVDSAIPLPNQIDQSRASEPAPSPSEARTEPMFAAKAVPRPGSGAVSAGGASIWWQRSRAMVWIAGAAILLVVVVAAVLLAGLLSGSEGEEPAGTAAAGTGVVLALASDASCLLGPATDYPAVAQLGAGQQLAVLGMSADEAWWNVVHPEDPADSCWLPASVAQVTGDISMLPLVEAPPLPTATSSPSVVIQQITVDHENRYVVDYLTAGFTEKIPGTHLHFFFNTFSPEQVGMSGTGDRLIYGGPSPFTGYATTDRPVEATGMCVLVANPDHSVVLESGNCFPFPVVGGDVREESPAPGTAEAVALGTLPPTETANPAISYGTPALEPTASVQANTPAELTPTTVPPTPTPSRLLPPARHPNSLLPQPLPPARHRRKNRPVPDLAGWPSHHGATAIPKSM